VHERFSRQFFFFVVNGIKVITQCGLSDEMSQIRAGEAVTTFDLMPTFGDVFELCGIDPGNRGGHHGAVDVIDHNLCITGLAFAAANILFDFLETRLDFPSGAIVLDDLLNRQLQIRREKRNPLCFSKNPDNPDRALECFEHDRL